MATPSITGHGSASTATVTTQVTVTAGAGDLMVAFCRTDFGATINSPTSSPSVTWTRRQAASPSNVDLAVYIAKVAAAGSYQVTSHVGTANSTNSLILYSLSGVASIDVTAGGGGTSGSSQAAPSVTATAANDLLICQWGSVQFNSTTISYTAPSGMTLDEQTKLANGASATMCAHEALSSSGATGTRTATTDVDADAGWAAITVAVRGKGTTETRNLSAAMGLGLGTQAGQAKSAGISASTGLGLGVDTGETKSGRLSFEQSIDLSTVARLVKHARGHVTATLGIALDTAAGQVKHGTVSARDQLAFALDAAAVMRHPIQRRDINVSVGTPTLAYSASAPTVSPDTACAPALGTWQAREPTVSYSVSAPYVQR